MTIQQIKDDCINIDIQNINADDDTIGTYINGKFTQFRDLHDVELFYSNISLKELLTIYSQYNGLDCYKKDNIENYNKSCNIDILELINELNK
tara:strand:- start:340 stop:618 length:279 start_codon:yes stop_codon:yes gene_type:complete